MPQLITRRATKDLPAQQREAAFQPSTFNDADNTVDVIISAGARVRRFDFWTGTKYEEELAVNADSVDLSRIDAGTVQVLDNHSIYGSVRNVLGVVTRAWIEGDQLIGTVRLSADPDKAGTVADIKAGILRAISVGYTVQRYEVTEADARTDGGAGDLWRATRWQPQEVSFVTVPADPAASTRSASAAASTTAPATAPTAPCEFITRGAATSTPKEPSMPKEDQAPANKANADQPEAERQQPAAPAAPAAAPQQPDQVFEANRAAEIAELCTRHNVAHMAADLIRRGVDTAAAKDAILSAIATRDAASGGHHNTRVETVRDETETRMRGMESAMLSRLDPAVQLDDNARQYRGLSLLDMGREHLEASGVRTRGMSKLQIATEMVAVRAAGMHHTSDFGALFTNVANRRLAAAYAAYPATYALWARQGASLSDFKPVDVISMGAGPDLLKVNEHGEFKYGTFSGSSERYQLATYGRIVAITRQAIINDDLRSFDRLIGLFGTSAKRLENSLVYSQLTANAAMADGKALFHADHGNLLTAAGSALSLTSLQTARKSLRVQKNADGQPIAVAPKYLIVPAALETEAYQLTSNAYTPANPSDVNDFRTGGRTQLEVIVEPLLDAASVTAWYLASDSAVIDTVEFAYLDGASGPYTETRTGFEVDGTEVKCRLDFAAKALDWRGLVKANGA